MIILKHKTGTVYAVSAAVIAALAVCCIVFPGGGAQKVIMAAVPALLTAAAAVMAASLKKSLNETLYTYKNIGLIAAMLFVSVLTVVFIYNFAVCVRAGDFSLWHIYRIILKFPRQFSFYAVFVIFALCILLGVSNVALMCHEGFRLRNALSVLVAAFYIGGTVLTYFVSDLLGRYVFVPGGTERDRLLAVLNTVIPMILLLVMCYFECVLAGTAVMGFKAARTVPSYDKDYIIILGCSIDRRGGLLPLLKGRVNRAIRFAWEQEINTGKPMKYVPSGGKGPNEVISEGSAMELYLMGRGAESYEIFPEKESRSTWENMCFSKKIIDGLDPDAKVVFATTNYHILRSGILARKAGLDAEGIAGDTKWYFWSNGFIREFFGILALNVREHVTVSAVIAAVCAVIGCVGYFGGLI